MRLFSCSPIVAALSIFAGAAGAATLDFTELGTGTIGSAAVEIGNARLFSDGDALYVGAGGVTNSICAFDVVTNSCAKQLVVVFLSDVTGLSFTVRGFDVGQDDISLFVFDPEESLSGNVAITKDERIDLSSFGVIAALIFRPNRTDGGGASYSDFDFEIVSSPPAIPLPAGLPLMLGGLGVLSLAGRRRKAATPN